MFYGGVFFFGVMNCLLLLVIGGIIVGYVENSVMLNDYIVGVFGGDVLLVVVL